MIINESHIAVFKNIETLTDIIQGLKTQRSTFSKSDHIRIGNINKDIARKEKEQTDLVKNLESELGPTWETKCMRFAKKMPGHLAVLVDTKEFTNNHKHIPIEDVYGVTFVVGGEAFEIRRAKRGMDGL